MPSGGGVGNLAGSGGGRFWVLHPRYESPDSSPVFIILFRIFKYDSLCAFPPHKLLASPVFGFYDLANAENCNFETRETIFDTKIRFPHRKKTNGTRKCDFFTRTSIFQTKNENSRKQVWTRKNIGLHMLTMIVFHAFLIASKLFAKQFLKR